MITNKDLSIDSENGKITLNGNKYDLGTQGEIDTAVNNVYSVMGQNGAKNLIPYPYYESDHTESGITWTVNSDGSVTANGTATANSTFIFRQRTEQTKFVEKNTSYILSGCPSGGSGSTYAMIFFVKNEDDSNVVSGAEYGDGRKIDMPNQDYYGIYAFARVFSGQTVSNLTFKPMLRLASDTDNTYEPYAMTNKQLTDQLGTKQDTLTFDTAPTAESTNPVTSGGVYTAIDAVSDDVEGVASGLFAISKKDITATTENDFLSQVFADIKADSNANNNASINRMYGWIGVDQYVIQAFRMSPKWIYAFVFSYDRAYLIEYNCNDNTIAVQKTFTLT